MPFSAELLDLYRKFRAAESKEERIAISMAIAESFLNGEYDITDYSASEEYHAFFTAYEQAQLALEHAALKAARVAVHIIDEYSTNHGLPDEEPVVDHSSN